MADDVTVETLAGVRDACRELLATLDLDSPFPSCGDIEKSRRLWQSAQRLGVSIGRPAPDWFRLETSDQVLLAAIGRGNISVSTSQVFEALAAVRDACQDGSPEHQNSGKPSIAKPKGRKRPARANQVMMETVDEQPAARGWTVEQWHEATGFAKSTIHGTQMWKKLHAHHESVRVFKAIDRHQKKTHRSEYSRTD
jgi:hypothetical protein